MDAYDPVVRFYNPAKTDWVGCGVIVAGPVEDAHIHVLTCAHVVGSALGDKTGIGTSENPPTEPVYLSFAADPGSPPEPIRGFVRPEAWRRTEIEGEVIAGAVDIAVIRLDIDALPRWSGQGGQVRYPQLAERSEPGDEVKAYGPRDPGYLALSSPFHWPDGEVRSYTQADQTEIRFAGDIELNQAVEGFSGGPLTDAKTLRVTGLMRLVHWGTGRVAYATPISAIQEVWPPVRAMMMEDFGAPKSLYDLIDRTDQVSDLQAGLRARMEACRSGAPGGRRLLLTAGQRDDDMRHMRRRLGYEVAQYAAEQVNPGFFVANVQLDWPSATRSTNVLDDLRKQLQAKIKAGRPDLASLREALNRGSSGGWLVQIQFRQRFTADDGSMLEELLAYWDKLIEPVVVEVYLALHFTYCDKTEAESSAALAHRGLLHGEREDVIDLQRLLPVNLDDIDEWRVQIRIDDLVETDAQADRMAEQVESFFVDSEMRMGHLLRAIVKEGLDRES